QNEGRPGLRQLLHDHDLGDRIDQCAALTSKLFEIGQSRSVLGVEVGEEIREQALAQLGSERGGVAQQGLAERRPVAKLSRLERGELPAEDVDLIDQSILEAPIAE